MTVAEPATADPAASAGRGTPPRLPERPPLSAPERPREGVDAEGPRAARQPRLGLIGLLLLVPIAAALAVGADGADGSVAILGPLVAYSLPLVAMVAFWWEDWPGTRLGSSWSGWEDTALIGIGAIVLTGIGQILAGGLDLRGMFDPSPGPGHVPTFPATLPLAGAAFVAMLQLTLVGEGWPLRRLPRLGAGPLALAISWAVALVMYLTLAHVPAPSGSEVTVRHGPVPGGELGTVLVVIGAWQVLFYVAWRGWPFSAIATRSRRLTYAHVVVIAGGVLTYLLLHDVMGVRSASLAAVAGCFVAAGLLFGMLLEGWLRPHLAAGGERIATLLAALVLAAVLAVGLRAIAGGIHFTRASADEWVEHVGLNAIGVSIILHMAIGRRWPFAAAPSLDRSRVPRLRSTPRPQ
jgi:hypothetical protein